MMEVFVVRSFAYSFLPLLLAAVHIRLDKQARSAERRIEIFLLYLFAVSVGASGLGGAFGHLFLSDQVANSIGWPSGSPFQLEMGFANLVLGVLGFVSLSRRDGFRIATILATTIIGVGATGVHLLDIAREGNLSPGNTVQNVSNLLDPILFIWLMWLRSRLVDSEEGSVDFARWQLQQQLIALWSAVGIGSGFGIGFAVGGALLWTVVGALAGIAIGVLVSRRMGQASVLPAVSDGRIKSQP